LDEITKIHKKEPSFDKPKKDGKRQLGMKIVQGEGKPNTDEQNAKRKHLWSSGE